MEDVDTTIVVSKKSIHNLRMARRVRKTMSHTANGTGAVNVLMPKNKRTTALCGALREMRRSGDGSLQHSRMGMTGGRRKKDHRAHNT